MKANNYGIGRLHIRFEVKEINKDDVAILYRSNAKVNKVTWKPAGLHHM